MLSKLFPMIFSEDESAHKFFEEKLKLEACSPSDRVLSIVVEIWRDNSVSILSRIFFLLFSLDGDWISGIDSETNYQN